MPEASHWSSHDTTVRRYFWYALLRRGELGQYPIPGTDVWASQFQGNATHASEYPDRGAGYVQGEEANRDRASRPRDVRVW